MTAAAKRIAVVLRAPAATGVPPPRFAALLEARAGPMLLTAALLGLVVFPIMRFMMTGQLFEEESSDHKLLRMEATRPNQVTVPTFSATHGPPPLPGASLPGHSMGHIHPSRTSAKGGKRPGSTRNPGVRIPVPSSSASLVSVQAQPPGFSRVDGSFTASIAGTWFTGKHHWATGTKSCPSGCHITFVHDANPQEADALLFHGHSVDLDSSRATLQDMQASRSSKLLLFYSAENFPAMTDPSRLQSFNGEVSYRQRSVAREVQYPLEAVSRLERVDAASIGDTSTTDFMSKTWNDLMATPTVPVEQRPMVADATISWASNHCGSTSGREVYVTELLKWIHVEVYTAPCLKNAPLEKQQLSWQDQWSLWRTYKFYLAFENSRCDDYVTEKFYLALVRGQVPIVLGASNIVEHAPSRDSYIDVRDYATPQALAEHLRYLDGNNTAYSEYHAWRGRPLRTYGRAFRSVLADSLPVAQKYGAKAGHADGTMFACSLCHGLAAWSHLPEADKYSSTVPVFGCDAPIAPQADGSWH